MLIDEVQTYGFSFINKLSAFFVLSLGFGVSKLCTIAIVDLSMSIHCCGFMFSPMSLNTIRFNSCDSDYLCLFCIVEKERRQAEVGFVCCVVYLFRDFI